ncbi:hypothetical protein SAMN06296008_12031 [Polynucleobacter kasalickyi]|uniref:Uncharacterized protein n=2 Tax=Polynucleobacter kasalickyi TaxID=1938817 RepID=A0A1W2C8V5_9BURK|nr:hypothetical protein SAMN06296008_12031 [Polynucleobacter kasalickyi]
MSFSQKLFVYYHFGNNLAGRLLVFFDDSNNAFNTMTRESLKIEYLIGDSYSMTKFLASLGFFYVFAFSHLANAYEPFFTEDAGTLEPGKYQLDLYFYNIFEKSVPNPQGNAQALDPEDQIYFGGDRSIAFPMTISRGITEKIEASFGLVYYQQPNGAYLPFANWQLGAKYRFYGDGNKGWSFAVRPYLNIPETKEQQIAGIGMAKLGGGSNMIGAYYGRQFDVYLNADLTYAPYNKEIPLGADLNPDNRTTLYTFGVAPVWKVNLQLKIGFDIALVSALPNSESPFNTSLQFGFLYSIRPDIDLVASYLRTSHLLTNNFVEGPHSSIGKMGISIRF